MRDAAPLTVLWRRKWIILATTLLFAAGTAVASTSLEKVYSTDATLLVALPAEDQSFDAVQASQSVARSYADIIDSPNVAELVAERLGGGTSVGELLAATEFEPVPETQLLRITAESSEPRRAKAIADAYADAFIAYASRELERTTNTTVTLADEAPVPGTASRPKPVLYTLIGVLLGAGLGVALAFFREQLDTRLRTQEDVERELDLPILASIPQRGRSEASQRAFNEAYRVLRTNIQFAAGDSPVRSLAVVSAQQGDGKTTTVAQLALATATAGLRVVVLEADMRRPTLHRDFAPDRETPPQVGLSNYLVGAASLEEVVHETSVPNIDWVPAGPLPPSSSALLDASRAQRIVPDLLRRFDFVIADCPPLGVAADASLISGRVDGEVLVVSLRGATIRPVREAVRQLGSIGTRLMGVVVNRDRRAGAYYDYYGERSSRNGRSRLEAPQDRPLARG